MKRLLQSIFVLIVSAGAVWAQPANDNCSGAIPLTLGADEESVELVSGDTRGATGDPNVTNVCSGSWFRDDIWFQFSTPATFPEGGVIVRAYFGEEQTDVPAVGMAIYEECGETTPPIYCYSSDDPNADRQVLSPICAMPGQTYFIRIWSGGDSTRFSGTLRIGVYNAEEDTRGNILYEETFGNGLADWTTFGTCGGIDTINPNAVWEYWPEGIIDRGFIFPAGWGIAQSPTYCDGGVGVESDFNDRDSTVQTEGTGPCPSTGQYFLVSQVFNTTTPEWDVAGISIAWSQMISQFQSQFFVGFRAHSEGEWSDWTDIEFNQDQEVNTFGVESNERFFLPGAAGNDSLQIRFVYLGDYYHWIIDDVVLVETEANNMRSQDNWFAVAPFNVPVGQERTFVGMNDILNAGAVAQTNVNLNLTVRDGEGNEVYNDNLDYGTIGPDSLAENVNFETPVNYSGRAPQTFTGTYTVTSDQSNEETDFDFSDNTNEFTFSTNAEGIYEYEPGPTGSWTVSAALLNPGAPHSLTWGNYFAFPNGGDCGNGEPCEALSITWGTSNPDELGGRVVNVILFEWDDLNEDMIVQAGERQILGFNSVTLTGDEGGPDGDPADFTTELQNFNSPGDPVLLRDGGQYLAMVEYNAIDSVPMFVRGTDRIDYGAVHLSSTQAGDPRYFAVTGFSPDGNVQGIDYEVTEFGNDGRTFLGFDLIPSVKLQVSSVSSTSNILDDANVMNVFPNPASDRVNVQIDLAENFDRVDVFVISMDGRLVESHRLGNSQQETIDLNVSNYANGAYIVKLQTEKGIKTERFVVQH